MPYWNQYCVGLPPAVPCARSVAAWSVTSVGGSVAPPAQPAATSANSASVMAVRCSSEV